MKNLLKTLSLIIVILSISSCTVESINDTTVLETTQSSFTCTNSDPEARFTNNGTIDFTFRIYDATNAMVVEELNVAPGSSTTWSSFSEGDIMFSMISSSNGVMDIKTIVTMSNCTAFDVTVKSDNTLDSNQPIGQ